MNKLYGAILGDLAGMPYEKKFNLKLRDIKIHPDGAVITDDTIMTLAAASKLVNNTSYDIEYRIWGNEYFSDYYGKSFKEWLKDDDMIVDSYGNGCLMRMSPIPYFYDGDKINSALEALKSTGSSHMNLHSRFSCQVLNDVYQMIFERYKKEEIHDWIDEYYPHFPNGIDEHFEPFQTLDATAQGTLPFVLYIFLTTNSTHEAILKAISFGGDTDTNASIVGELSNAYYDDLTQEDIDYVESHLDLKQLEMLHKFNSKLWK
tara:strand:- start:3040 stop:3822 length:783 start_codon:yes stop_codon:yes gene_type:complete